MKNYNDIGTGLPMAPGVKVNNRITVSYHYAPLSMFKVRGGILCNPGWKTQFIWLTAKPMLTVHLAQTPKWLISSAF